MTAHKHAALMLQYAQDARDAYVSAKRKLHVGCTL